MPPRSSRNSRDPRRSGERCREPGNAAACRAPASTDAAAIAGRLGYRFHNQALLRQSLTHRSFAGADPGRNNEQLEFLGDAVLSLAMTDLLIHRFPEQPEGDLSKVRASLVNEAVLARKAAELDLGSSLLLGKGEERTRGREKLSILAGAYEAVLGAVYLDGGFAAAREMVARHFGPAVDAHESVGFQDYKTELQELTQAWFRELPAYHVVCETGPDHDKRFISEISVAGTVYGRGSGRSKKIAEQAAALQALERLRQGHRE